MFLFFIIMLLLLNIMGGGGRGAYSVTHVRPGFRTLTIEFLQRIKYYVYMFIGKKRRNLGHVVFWTIFDNF